jgi:hypothetical protein
MERLDTITQRVLADLRDRMEKEAGGVEASGQVTRGEREGSPARPTTGHHKAPSTTAKQAARTTRAAVA